MPNILGKILFIITLSIFLNANSSFTLNLSKDKVYVGEAIKATLTLTYDLESPIMRTDFDEFLASNFWIKELDESEPIKKGETTYINYTFLIFPQISGNLTIEPQHLRTAIREAKTNLIIWSDNYTQEKVIEVSPLPGLSLEVDKTNRIKVSGTSKEIVGEMAAKIRAIRPPDAYKGKGIRYAGERVHLKAGKSGKAIGKR